MKKHLPLFIKDANAAYRDVLPPNFELLYSFIEHLGKINKSFKGLGPEHLSTGWKGVYQIYDMVRKNAQ